MEPTDTGLTTLPLELLENILHLLCRGDVARLSLVCRELRLRCERQLWQAVSIRNKPPCHLLGRAIRLRPAVAELVEDLKVVICEELHPSHGDVYDLLELIASLPNLKRLTIRTLQREYDRVRSLEAAERFGMLKNLEFCDVQHYHENGDNWTADDLPALLSLLKKPSVRGFRLRHFKSSAGIESPIVTAKPSLYKLEHYEPISLELWDCDVDTDDISEMLGARQHTSLEILYLHNGEYPPLQIGLEDPEDVIAAIQRSMGRSLNRLSFYRIYDQIEQGHPLSFHGCESLQYLRTSCQNLLGFEPDDIEWETLSVRLLLPPRLKVLEILTFQRDDPEQWCAGLVKFILERQGRDAPHLVELRICTPITESFAHDINSELTRLGERAGIPVNVHTLSQEM